MKNNYFKTITLIVLTFSVLTSFAQTKLQKEQITSRYDKQEIQKLETEFTAKSVLEKKRALQLAKINNWPTIIEKDGKYAELQKVVDGKPIYYTTFNVDAAKSTRTDHLNSGGSLGLNLMGQNMTAYVWDGGVATTAHVEFDGSGGSNRFSVGDGSSSLNFHAGHVTGTIIASGLQANAKGMASHASAIGSDWNSDLAEATTAAGNGMLLSNHSYGFAFRNQFGQVQLPQNYFGGYITESRDWDNLMFNAPNYLMVVAAGNDGDDNTANNNPTGGSGFDKLTGHSTSKNNLVVANAQDASIDSNGNLVSVSINSSSSEGPTDDFRIKPDITGNGTGVYSSFHWPSYDAVAGTNNADGNINDDYASITGTSMASPNVMGSLLLLQQHANNVNGSFMRAATLKGLALHTADDAGVSGPDVVYGWGLLNAKRAAEAITQNGNEAKIEELTLTSGQTYQITVDSDGVNDLMASISWTDRPGTANTTINSTTPVLVNDLDIRITKGSTTSLPYELTGALTNARQDNNVDPFERVDVSNASGTYTITVTHKGSLTGGSQNYTLIVTGLTGTPVVCNATTPTGLNVDGFGSDNATVSWDTVTATTYDLRYRVSGTSSWTTSAENGTTASLSGLSPETTYQLQVRSKCSDGSNSSYSSTVTFTTTEVQLNYCASNGNDVSDEHISNVTLGNINNTTGAASSGYADYTSQSTSLTQGDNYTISITPTWSGTLYNEGYSVWIDYNHDGDFTDNGEQVWSQAASQTTPVSGSFTIPNSTHIGNTRMRVSMQYNAVPSSCGSFNYGEVEDYTVNLGAGVADTTAPVITITGAATINLSVGDSYTEQGATATDNIDGNLTSSIVTSGSVNTAAVGTYTINYNVSDAAGNAATQVSRTVNVSDNTAPVITLNGAATVNLNVGDSYTEQGATATDNVDGNLTSNIVTTGSVNMVVAGTYTINYNVSDAAGNAATEVSRTVNVSEVNSGGCSGGITSFPYSEGFENTLGAWTQSTSDDINWTVDANGTPSSGTGPSSASEGTYYVYVEASGSGSGYPNKRAILNSPCYDLTNETEASFTFKYHMYGDSDMGTIALEASNNNGATWTSIWNESGNKGNSWETASVNLAGYVGGAVQLRFNRVTGATWKADIAIDDVSLTAGGGTSPTCSNVNLSITFDNYPEETAWSIVNASGTTVASGGTYASQADGSSLSIDVGCLDDGCYDFIITDVYGDGICCSFGNGSYSLTNSDSGSTLASGGQFTSSQTTNFCLGGSNVNSEIYTTTISDNPNQYFKVHPNPVKQTLNIDLVGYEAQTFEIKNMLGQTVLKGRYTSTIDVSRFDDGVYMLQLNIGEKTKIERFIKE